MKLLFTYNLIVCFAFAMLIINMLKKIFCIFNANSCTLILRFTSVFKITDLQENVKNGFLTLMCLQKITIVLMLDYHKRRLINQRYWFLNNLIMVH